MQGCEIDVRNWQAEPISAHGAVEHPCWDFKKSIRRRTRKAAAENMRPFGRLMDVNKSPDIARTRAATDTKVREPRSRGCSVVVLYNRNRPHSSLGNITPSEFAKKMAMEKQAA